MKDIYIDQEDFKKGLYALEDTTKAPLGTARVMRNMRVADSGGLAPRLGIQTLGTHETATTVARNIYTFTKSFGRDEFLMRPHGTKMYVYSKNHSDAGWWVLKDGFTTDSEFGFATSLVNKSDQDYLVFCNRYQPYYLWTGSVTRLNGSVTGGATSIVVDSTVEDEVLYSGTATGVPTSTTVSIASSTDWVASQWINLYIVVTSGTRNGEISKITANTSTQLTFGALTGAMAASDTFEIRRAKFPPTGTIIYNGTEIAYTDIPNRTTFTVASAHAGTDNQMVAFSPVAYVGNPRGNRMANYLGRVVLGNVRAATARDNGGALQGYSSAGSYFVSKITDPSSFDFAAVRVAGEGDIVGTPYGGGDITDVVEQEDKVYVFKKRYIEAAYYSQDANDIIIREPLKSEVGSMNRVTKGRNDVFFITGDKQFTSLGRVASKDVKPQTDNLGLTIRTLLESYEFDKTNGIEFGDRIFINGRSSADVAENDIVIVYNQQNKAFEGIWDIDATSFTKFNDKFYVASVGPNVYELNVGHADVINGTRYPIVTEYASHYMNLTSSKVNLQAINSVYFEGYITANTTITFNLWKDFGVTPFFSFDFGGTEEELQDGSELSAYFGSNPFGLKPIGTIGELGVDARRHFQFRIYFPFEYGNYFSVGWQSDGVDEDYEILRYGLAVKEDVTLSKKVKSLN